MYLTYIFVLTMLAGYNFQKINVKTLSVDEYGPIVLDSYEMIPCKGPKQVNMTYSEVKIIQKPDYKFFAKINTTFLNSCAIEELKISVYRDVSKVLVYNYIIKNVCKHFVLGGVFMHLLNTDSRCIVKKASYFGELDITAIFHSFVGSKFFYGKFFNKVVGISKKGNIFCYIIRVSLIKKIV